MRLGKLSVSLVLPLLLPALLLQAGTPNTAQQNELALLRLHCVDVSQISLGSPTLLASASSNASVQADDGYAATSSLRYSKPRSKKWVKWVWIGSIAATVLVGSLVWASQHGPFTGLDGP